MAGRAGGHPEEGPGASFHLFALAQELQEGGQAFALVTVVDRAGPVSAHVGDKALVTPDGRVVGWVGGSCSRSVVLREAEAALLSGRPRLVRVVSGGQPGALPNGLGGSELVVAPMSCASGGELLLYVEPYLPAPGLVVFGSTPVARALGRLGREAGFRVLRVFSREESDEAAEAGGCLLGEVTPERLRGFQAAVAATHGLYDEESLELALNAEVGYVGLVASRRRAEAVRAYLAGRGWSPSQLERVRSPVGLDIGGVTAGEVAISILAEIVAWRRGRTSRGPQPVAEAAGSSGAMAHETGGAGVSAEHAADVATAIDPVCGMAVAVATARFTAEHDGHTYYFCCPACRRRFLEQPEAYTLVHG